MHYLVGPPLLPVDVFGTRGKYDHLEALRQLSINLSHPGPGLVDDLVVGAGAQSAQHRSGLGHVNNGLRHLGEHSRILESRHALRQVEAIEVGGGGVDRRRRRLLDVEFGGRIGGALEGEGRGKPGENVGQDRLGIRVRIHVSVDFSEEGGRGGEEEETKQWLWLKRRW